MLIFCIIFPLFVCNYACVFSNIYYWDKFHFCVIYQCVSKLLQLIVLTLTNPSQKG